MIGGLFDQQATEYWLAKVLHEEQLYALLHMGTLLSSYSNYFTGIVMDKFKYMVPRESYFDHFKKFREEYQKYNSNFEKIVATIHEKGSSKVT